MAFGAVEANCSYARTCAGRAGGWLYYANYPLGLALMWVSKHISDAHLLYCPARSETGWGGYRHSSRGWNPSGGDERAERSYTLSSYYYRYIHGSGLHPSKAIRYLENPKTGILYTVYAYPARIGVLAATAPVALWDANHDNTTGSGAPSVGFEDGHPGARQAS